MTHHMNCAGQMYANMIWPAITEDQKTLISFGMTDVLLADKAEAYIRDEIAEQYCKANTIPDKHKSALARAVKQHVVDEFLKGFTVGLMNERKKEGLMVA